jgi:uridine phosphorylase
LGIAGKLYVSNKLGIVKMAGIGAPHAVSVLEELIELKGKKFIIIGTAGGLQDEGVFVCTKAIRDEGTSFHYLKPEKYAYPDRELTKSFINCIKKHNIDFKEGISWTIDAPYRETKKEVNYYKKEGVSTVEMEASGLFAVALVRKVKICASFVVSDLLDKKWKPQFDKYFVRRNLNKLIDVAVEYFSKVK